MPEGDTVWLAGHNLRAAFEGTQLTRSDFRVPRYATVDLGGRRVDSIASRGKHLLWRFDGGISLHTHFRMDGSWRLYRRGKRWQGPGHEIRVVLEASHWVAVGYRMPVLELIDTSSEREAVGHLGPDLLGEDWDPGEAVARLRARAATPVGEALLDQTIMAGIGNVYKCELCFLQGLSPWTPVSEAGDLERLVGRAQALLEANRYTAKHVTTGDARPGRTHWVYGRAGRPCLRCGTQIRRSQQPSYGSERVVYWCPSCQPSSSK